MIYTSGSTGIPKGVLKSHNAEISFINAYSKTFSFTGDEKIGNQTPFFFDASAKDIYMTLCLGCTLVIIPSEVFGLPTMLIEYLNEKKVTFASWVPTVLSIVAQLNPFSYIKPMFLTKVFFVGEVMPMKYLNIWRENLPNIQYVNLYGQTEIAGICLYYIIDKEFKNTESLPMGKALSNCRIYLINDGKIINNIGEIGEIYVESPSLALGYYNNELKTKESFISKDFGNGIIRCFKTGDLAYYNEEGELIYASRTDFQIKHMGYRIELGEIEAIANSFPEVVHCCCLYDQKRKSIILFCELFKDDVENFRKYLNERLPTYMRPNKIERIEKIPLNANGKIDRQELKKKI